MHLIKTHYQLSFWLLDLKNWHIEYQDYINEKSYNLETNRFWYTQNG